MEIKKDFYLKHVDGAERLGQIVPAALVYIFNDNKEILLFKRKKPPYQDFWETIGGKIRFGEKIIEAAMRELNEESGLKLEPKFVGVFDHIEGDSYHRILIAFAVKIDKESKIKLSEHDECKWFKISQLPENTKPGPIKEAYNNLFEN